MSGRFVRIAVYDFQDRKVQGPDSITAETSVQRSRQRGRSHRNLRQSVHDKELETGSHRMP